MRRKSAAEAFWISFKFPKFISDQRLADFNRHSKLETQSRYSCLVLYLHVTSCILEEWHKWVFTYSSIVVLLNSLVVLVRWNFLGRGQLFWGNFVFFRGGGEFCWRKVHGGNYVGGIICGEITRGPIVQEAIIRGTSFLDNVIDSKKSNGFTSETYQNHICLLNSYLQVQMKQKKTHIDAYNYTMIIRTILSFQLYFNGKTQLSL